jgi:histidine triad (HIT) family protein
MNECIFCKLVANEIPSYTVHEDAETRSFLDIFGATDGHTMVVLKKHGATIHDYTQEELGSLWASVKKVSKAIEKTYDTHILSIGINHGEPEGVKHLHVHIMPRFEGDGGGIIQSLPGKPLQNNDFVSVAHAIKANLNE